MPITPPLITIADMTAILALRSRILIFLILRRQSISFSLASSLSSAAETCASIEHSDQNKECELTSEIVRRNSEYEIHLEQISTAKRIIQSKRWQYGVRGKRLSEPPSSFSHPPPENPPAVDIPQDQYQLIQAAVIPESIGSNQITAVSIQNCQRLSPGLYSYSLLVSGHCQNTNIITHTSEDFYRLQATLEDQYKGKYKIPNLPTPLTVGVEHSWKRRCLLSVILKEKQEKFEAFCNNIIRMPASVSRCHIVNEFFSIQCESYEM
ncbi:hypothetical protein BKA69DRAFT_1082123 [Paraphysoderma sedebokerense]|nr:hypothetical protein BKA69DRAFT_1082123 [Paraphysoderma sedebokerense]